MRRVSGEEVQFCDHCHMWPNCSFQWQEHILGRKHRKKFRSGQLQHIRHGGPPPDDSQLGCHLAAPPARSLVEILEEINTLEEEDEENGIAVPGLWTAFPPEPSAAVELSAEIPDVAEGDAFQKLCEARVPLQDPQILAEGEALHKLYEARALRLTCTSVRRLASQMFDTRN